ncbi:hypothetical protein [uncultured Bacteroides sp.]|uniref:hypothetical protein n=1 Tax=uncultured Bacteroides sp. TaxID=162156 RepID=UPI00262786EE|nr:hypothetical protein [uncultured Bacteroides sp.]
MEDSYILGIKRNGVSLKIDTLTFEADQSGYEYISNINRVSRSGGNGQYNITVTDHNLIQGCPIGNGWKLISGNIYYYWSEAYAYFIMSDEHSVKTKEILASQEKTPLSKGYNIDALAKSIFFKAHEIVLQFPSASIYNAYMDFVNKKPKSHLGVIDREDNSETVKGFINGNYEKIADYIDKYKQLSHLLSNSENPKCEQLLMDIDAVMLEFIKEHFK